MFIDGRAIAEARALDLSMKSVTVCSVIMALASFVTVCAGVPWLTAVTGFATMLGLFAEFCILFFGRDFFGPRRYYLIVPPVALIYASVIGAILF